MKLAALLIALIAGGILAGFLLSRETVVPGPPPVFLVRYDKAVEESKSEGKPLVLVFSARWCPLCHVMKKRVYPTANVAAVKDQFVWVNLDIEESANLSAVAQFEVKGLPAIFVLGRNQQILARTDGNHTAASFVEWLRQNSGK